MLLPAAAVLDGESHMFRRAGAVLDPAQQGAVAVADELGRFRFLDDLFSGVDVGDQVHDVVVARRDLPAGAPHVQAEVIADHLRPREVSLRRPLLGRLAPVDLEQADAIHRLMFQDAVKAFLTG